MHETFKLIYTILEMQYKENVEMKSMVEMQREVDEYIGQFKTGYFFHH